MRIETPYLLFLGDAADALAAKVALGIRDWRPQNCVGQLRLPGCNADCGLPDLSVEEACESGARTLVLGVANRGGVIGEHWINVIVEALDAGMDVAAGMHGRLADVPVLTEAAARNGCALHDVRRPAGEYHVGSGVRRPGKRILPVGTDCSCGKMYTALALEREMRMRGWNAEFRATGQSGILITGSGVPIDAVVADFIAGAVEALSPANDDDHWDCIEGQGSLFHPSYAGVSMGLLHGAQPDALVLCHEPTRTHMRGVPDFPLPDIDECIDFNLRAARRTNPEARFVGVAVNTSALDAQAAKARLAEIEAATSLPAVDPFRDGIGRIVDALG